MKQIIYPVYCAHMLSQSDRELVFRTPSGKICKFKSNFELILELLNRCNGTASVQEITHVVSEKMHLAVNLVDGAIEDLAVCEILMDSREQFLTYHTLTYNPSRYPITISLSEIEELTQRKPDYITKEPIAVYEDINKLSLPVFDVLQNRHSCRSFCNVPVELEKLFAICKASYSYQLQPVASAGALYPLSIYFINQISSKQLPIGLYQYDPQMEKLLLLKNDSFLEEVQYSLNDAECVFGAPCIFFVCADIERHMKKYANSGYRYVLLEVGHALQNMTIAVGELGLGGVEYGGFCDEAVKQLFQMRESVFPLACYALGYEDKKQIEIFLQKAQKKRVIEKIVRHKGLNIILFSADNQQFRLSNRRVIVAKFKDTCEREEFGTGIAPAYGTAYIKAVMEAYERYTLSCRYSDREECAEKLDDVYLDPNEYVPYSDAQVIENNFSKFSKKDIVEWLQGYDLDGNRVYVPADLCFVVSGNKRLPYHVANTSGCAAHFDITAAEQAAVLELIERDAIMKHWFYKQTPDRFREDTLPNDVKCRFRKYLARDIPIYILLLSYEYAYVVLVCSVDNNSPPYFVSGGGASFSTVEEAIGKAFDEWEASFILGNSTEGDGIMTPEDVFSPKDHGMLYRYRNHNREIDYLCHGQEVNFFEVDVTRLKNIRELFPVFVRYKSFIDGAYVVRAFSKELIPINFGFGMDFYKHSKVDKQLLKNYEFPHFFS